MLEKAWRQPACAVYTAVAGEARRRETEGLAGNAGRLGKAGKIGKLAVCGDAPRWNLGDELVDFFKVFRPLHFRFPDVL